MYIIKNALKCISRSKGRNTLIGIIVFAIAVSACLGLSIRQAAENAKIETLEGMSVTANISFDRQSMMGSLAKSDEPGGGFDQDSFAEMMGGASSLTLEEYQKYAQASTVKDSYYQLTASLNCSDGISPVSSDTEEESGGFIGSFGGKGNQMRNQSGDFSLVGVSSEKAMTSFIDGTAAVTEGEVFSEGTHEFYCLVSEELSTYNGIEVGDSFNLQNPNNEEEIYSLTVSGIYTDSASNEEGMFNMGDSNDPANKIYLSYNALNKIIENSASSAQIVTDENTGREYSTGISGMLNFTYVFENTDDYYTFEKEVYTLGLDDTYTVSSGDITAFENSIIPLQTLSTMAGYFLIVILAIGAIILVVLNIFNVRERKYEIGVLTAMGMKKGKVALQFLTEIFLVTILAVTIGAIIGGVTSVPITNALLEAQTTSATDRAEQIEQGFGRGDRPEMPDGPMQGGDKGGGRGPFENFGNMTVEYITQIDSAMNFTVVLQMLGIAVLLTLAAGAVSMMFVMRYEPLKILSNRD